MIQGDPPASMQQCGGGAPAGSHLLSPGQPPHLAALFGATEQEQGRGPVPGPSATPPQLLSAASIPDHHHHHHHHHRHDSHHHFHHNHHSHNHHHEQHPRDGLADGYSTERSEEAAMRAPRGVPGTPGLKQGVLGLERINPSSPLRQVLRDAVEEKLASLEAK